MKLGFPFGARRYFSVANLIKFYNVQIRTEIKYCSYVRGAAAPTSLSQLDAVQKMGILNAINNTIHWALRCAVLCCAVVYFKVSLPWISPS